MRPSRMFAVGIAVLGLLAFTTAACGSEEDGGAAPTVAPADQGQVLEIAAKDMAFTASELRVKAGQTFTVRFDNQDEGVRHNFAIYKTSAADELIAATEISAGPDTQELTVKGGLPASEYFFRCDVHPATMTGTLIVE